MAVHLLGIEICFDYEDERCHVTLPARLSAIIGRQGRLRCRLDAVRRPDRSVAMSCSDPFDSDFDGTRGLVLPRDLANRRGLSIDSRIDITLEARVGARRWTFWRRARLESICPNDETIDMSDDRPGAPTGDAMRPDGVRGEARDGTASEQAHLNVLRRRAAAEMAMIQAAIEAPAGDQELRRMRMALARADGQTSSPQAGTGTPEEASAERRRQQEIQALYRTVKDSRLGTGDGTWPSETESGESRAGRVARSRQSARR